MLIESELQIPPAMYSRRWSVVLVAGLVAIIVLGALAPGIRWESSGTVGVGTESVVPPGLDHESVISADATTIRALDQRVYQVNFTESGLPGGTVWQVSTSISGTGFAQSNSSNSPTVTQRWSNGTYAFTTEANVANYTSNPLNPPFSVTGDNVTISVQFFPAHAVVFGETGLPRFNPWTVLVQGNGTVQNVTQAGSSISVPVPVGPFNYTVRASGFNATPENGSGTVISSGVNVPISFSAILPPPGYITGVCNVGSAALYLNGLRTYVQLGGGFFFSLEPGPYSVIVAAQGYVTYYNETFVTSGNTTHMDIILDGANSTIPPLPASTPGIDTLGWVLIGSLAGGVVVLGVVASVYAVRAERAARALKSATQTKF
jgi:hypothetical protein